MPSAETKGALSGPLCNVDRCTCKTAAADAGVPDDPKYKRFEIRLTSPQPLWLTYHGGQLYKSAERAEDCFYVDLPAGSVPMEMRASNPSGVSAKVTISELGTKTKSWYETYSFNCGSPGVCSFDDLDAAKREWEATKRNLHDKCGSTKVKSVSWDTGHAADQLHPSELAVRFSLDIYKHEPTKPHGDPTCGSGRATTTEGDDPATPAAP
ncbi:MAG TPA: hypothetical protein VGM88_02405 [Kofleriaceae bacterium]